MGQEKETRRSNSVLPPSELEVVCFFSSLLSWVYKENKSF